MINRSTHRLHLFSSVRYDDESLGHVWARARMSKDEMTTEEVFLGSGTMTTVLSECLQYTQRTKRFFWVSWDRLEYFKHLMIVGCSLNVNILFVKREFQETDWEVWNKKESFSSSGQHGFIRSISGKFLQHAITRSPQTISLAPSESELSNQAWSVIVSFTLT